MIKSKRPWNDQPKKASKGMVTRLCHGALRPQPSRTPGWGPHAGPVVQGGEQAWNRLRPTRTKAHFELWRQNRDWNAWKGREVSEALQEFVESNISRKVGAQLAPPLRI
jgi:hypothetical protein